MKKIREATPKELAEWRAESEKQSAEEERLVRCRRWEILLSAAGPIHADARLEAIDRDGDKKLHVYKLLEGYLANIQERVAGGQGLVLYGPVGSGKDFRLMAVAREAIRSGIRMSHLDGRLLAQRVFDDDWSDELVANKSWELLYISDPAVLNTPAQNRFGLILDYRARHRLATWCSVNVASRQELNERIGADNADRLLNRAVVGFCDWPSYRKTAMIDDPLYKALPKLPPVNEVRPRYTLAEPMPKSY